MFTTDISAGTGRIGRLVGTRCLVVLIALLWSGLCMAQIVNPSFEETFSYGPPFRPVPSYWWPLWNHPSFNSGCTDLWSTDGALSAGLSNRPGAVVFAGDYESLFQFVDLTGVSGIAFDAMLLADSAGGFGPFEASFLVNGVPLWSRTGEGLYLDQMVDVSAFSDYCMVELRIMAMAEGAFGTESGAFWDNMAFCEASAMTVIGASITLTPNRLLVGYDAWGPKTGWGSEGKWVTCLIELEAGYDATQIDSGTVVLVGGTGVLDGIQAYMGKERWARPEANGANTSDVDGDGLLERMVKFDRDAIEQIVSVPETEVTIQGLLIDGAPFMGTAVIRAIEKKPRYFASVQHPVTWRFQQSSPPANGKKK